MKSKMIGLAVILAASSAVIFTSAAPAPQEKTPDWIAQSDAYTKTVLAIQMKHHPESGSREGLAEYDAKASQPTLSDENAERAETEAAVEKLKAALAEHQQKEVAQDLQIIIRKLELGFKQQDYARAHMVPFLNASETVFAGLHILLDEQTPNDRRPAAVVRLREYAGMEDGYQPIAEIMKARIQEQMAKPGVTYPSRTEIEIELSRNSNYMQGIADLLKKYNLTGWEEPFAKLKGQLEAYDAWMKATVLPKSRTDFRLAPEDYDLRLQGYGIDIPPGDLARTAHQAFDDIQREMMPIAVEIAKERHLPSSDYRDVIKELKKQQIVGDAILPFYESRLKDIEKIIVEHQIVTLPTRPAKIRIASAAETAEQPAPHMQPPPFMHNTGQKGVFILPLNIPSKAGEASQQYDDFTYDAASWSLIAHEARPGHELQFDSMLDHGVSLARVKYAFNSTNVEGWGLYAEYLTKPYMPADGQLVSLMFRLQRAARAFLDPELQSGKLTREQAKQLLEKDVCLSPPFAEEEVERFTYRAPGQANSYFYGFTKLIALRTDTTAALGPHMDLKKFHDFILAQGLLPPDLLRETVISDFIPSQKGQAPKAAGN
jgi:uncharacterized protein (DUF885 family)